MKKILFLAVFALALSSTSCARNKAANNENAQITTEQAEEAVNYTVKTLPAGLKGEQIINTLKKEYAGKVVLVDIWATWCPPCRQAMKDIDVIKPELQKKGVQFVYLTGETSPKDTWTEMIKNISGIHYRMTDQQWKEMGASLGLVGIPAYMIINKDGSIGYTNVTEGGYPGNELIQNQLEVALTK